MTISEIVARLEEKQRALYNTRKVILAGQVDGRSLLQGRSAIELENELFDLVAELAKHVEVLEASRREVPGY